MVRQGSPQVDREIRFPRTEEVVPGRPACCPRCGFGRLRINGRCRRRVIDPRAEEVELVRFRCSQCGHSWRIYPAGVQPFTPQTQCQNPPEADCMSWG